MERALVRALQAAGFAAERVPLSGSAGGSYVGDLSVPLLGRDRVVEVKCRADGFKQLYSWLEHRDLLICKADHHEMLVVLPLALAITIARAAERGRSQ
jgi:Holliday junction resolvase